MWVGLMMLIIKKQPLVACMLSTAACPNDYVYDYNWNGLLDIKGCD